MTDNTRRSDTGLKAKMNSEKKENLNKFLIYGKERKNLKSDSFSYT